MAIRRISAGVIPPVSPQQKSSQVPFRGWSGTRRDFALLGILAVAYGFVSYVVPSPSLPGYGLLSIATLFGTACFFIARNEAKSLRAHKSQTASEIRSQRELAFLGIFAVVYLFASVGIPATPPDHYRLLVVLVLVGSTCYFIGRREAAGHRDADRRATSENLPTDTRLEKNPHTAVAYVGFFLVLTSVILFGSIFWHNDAHVKMDRLSTSIGMNVVGCACGIIGRKNLLGKIAVCLGATLAAFFTFAMYMAFSSMVMTWGR